MRSPSARQYCCVLALFLMVFPAQAAVITVTTGSDPIDIDSYNGTIDDLPGPDGKVSFSEAMIASNNTPGHDTVEFAIPEAEWEMQWLYPGYAVIYSSYTYYWRSFESVTIDGTTQESFTGDRNPDHAELMFYGTFNGSDIYLGGGDSIFMGVNGGEVSFGGSNNLATGNTGGIHINLSGGSDSEIRGNNCGTIKIASSSNNRVVGNVMQRVRIWGSGEVGLPGDGNMIGGPDLADRNFITGYGTTNSEGLPSGTCVEIAGATNTLIENNWIGTTVDGLEQGNQFCNVGIGFQGTTYNTVVRNNRIAGILGHGQGPHHAGQLFGWAIMIGGTGAGIEISGNTIGLDANDEPLLGSVTGIDVGTWNYSGVADLQITDNVVAGHLFNGIVVGANVSQARLSRNETFLNGWLGIDLIPTGYGNGVTENDHLDPDTGGNGLQNFPVVTSAVTNGSRILLEGTLHSLPGMEFTIEFFASPACDDSGHGEGQRYLGSAMVTTDDSGDAPFEVLLDEAVPSDWVATSTATLEPLGASSEFGACLPFEAGTIAVSAAPDLARIPAALSQPWPNPANPRVQVTLSLPRAGYQHVRVIDARGRAVATVHAGVLSAGDHLLSWDGIDDSGRPVSSGVYFVQIVGAKIPARRLALVR